ncbi:helix-turn-helix transcriptional regulator [Acinetobacter johnsonii]|uniref:helix-turn-helix transcriptional regulator n=1 Tax=Acinetobacter johnsonii TaxID=40214 RepID=UPI00191B03F5|nr:AlpA family transcriptional regulator [Acinetobacter johnsonii]QQT59059.1 AlpA family transcriptional regulator [Acinetobacter johnsonii]
MTAYKNKQTENQRLIRRKEVQTKTGLCTSSIYALMKKGDFPQSLQISIRRVAWIESEVDQWISDRIASHKATIAMMEV